ncbi:hypothetical protein FJT64_005300 [Amphibalanus amphitrite]|uniref:Uncharacterized protein n=1 Tax=Amphibalanus amphitrite TaxID=1232801 RepID=A0A6A4VRC5_AMPAM|nr:hypothetical protein FJT64_005300 [Amphibalanus amphitrite]
MTTGVRVTPCNISDHDLITALVADVKTQQVPETITVRSTRRVNTGALCLDLLQADWSQLYGADSTTNMWNSFLATRNPIIDRHMPMRTIRVRNGWVHDSMTTPSRPVTASEVGRARSAPHAAE